MKRTFVLLIIAAIYPQFSFSQTDNLALHSDISPTVSPFTKPILPAPNNKSDLLLYAQLKVRQGLFLASEMSGRINHFKLQPGQHFEAGQLLVDFSCSKEESYLESVKASLAKQEQIKQQLVDTHSINVLEIDLANTEHAEANANMQVAKAILGRCTVYAPFSGKVVGVFVKPTQFVRVGEPIMEIVDEKNREVELLVPSRQIANIIVGQNYRVNQDHGAKPYNIKITSLGGRVYPVSQTVKLYGHIADEDYGPLPSNDTHVALVSEKN